MCTLPAAISFLTFDFLNKCGNCHFIFCLHFSCVVLLSSVVVSSWCKKKKVFNFLKSLLQDCDRTATISALLLLYTKQIMLLDKDSVLSVDIFITAALWIIHWLPPWFHFRSVFFLRGFRQALRVEQLWLWGALLHGVSVSGSQQ